MAMQIAVIVPAAGAGRRFAEAGCAPSPSGKNKLELDLVGRPVFMRSVEGFWKRPEVVQILLAVDPDRLDEFNLKYGDRLAFHGVKAVSGGRAERWQTVLNALRRVGEDCTHVAIHDAARPLVSHGLIDRVFEAAKHYGAVVPARPVSATLKRVTSEGGPVQGQVDPLDAILGSVGKSQVEVSTVVETIDRNNLVEVQTPQIFEAQLLRRAYDQITQETVEGSGITDDACLVEALGETVYVVDGEASNLKITRPDDMDLATAYLQVTEQTREADLGRKRLFNDDDDE